MEMKHTTGNKSFVQERVSFNAGISMVAATVVPQVSGEMSHAAFHDVTNHLIILALFLEIYSIFIALDLQLWYSQSTQ